MPWAAHCLVPTSGISQSLGAPMLNLIIIEREDSTKELILLTRGPRLPGKVWVDVPFLVTFPPLVASFEAYYDYLWSHARVIACKEDLAPLFVLTGQGDQE